VLHETLGGELLESLPDRHLADAVLLGEPLLAQPLAGLEAAFQDLRADLFRDPLRKLLVSWRSGFVRHPIVSDI
jgi:hypothetical protein